MPPGVEQDNKLVGPTVSSNSVGGLYSVLIWASRSRKLNAQPKTLYDLLDRIVFRYDPLSVWLFGSRARGGYHQDSDWDLMIILDDSASDLDRDPIEVFFVKNGYEIPTDIFPITISEFVEDMEVSGSLAYEVAKDGITLYERK